MRRKFKVKINGKEYTVEIEEIEERKNIELKKRDIVNAPVPSIERKEEKKDISPKPSPERGNVVLAPMPGKIVKINVENGQSVNKGHVLMTLEAMKMENEITAPKGGVVKEIRVNEGDNVEKGAVLVVLSE